MASCMLTVGPLLTGLEVRLQYCNHCFTSFALGNVTSQEIKYIKPTLAQKIRSTLGYLSLLFESAEGLKFHPARGHCEENILGGCFDMTMLADARCFVCSAHDARHNEIASCVQCFFIFLCIPM